MTSPLAFAAAAHPARRLADFASQAATVLPEGSRGTAGTLVITSGAFCKSHLTGAAPFLAADVLEALLTHCTMHKCEQHLTVDHMIHTASLECEDTIIQVKLGNQELGSRDPMRKLVQARTTGHPLGAALAHRSGSLRVRTQ